MCFKQGRVLLALFLLLGVWLGLWSGNPVMSQTADTVIYDDALLAGWEASIYNDATININNAAPVYQGAHSIAITYNGGWAGAWLANWGSGLDVSAYDTLRLWINGGDGGGYPIVFTFHFDGDIEIVQTITPIANTWTRVDISLHGYTASPFYGIEMFNNSNNAHPTFYVDQIVLMDTGAPPPPTAQPTGGPALNVNVTAERHAISPYIYGMNFADEDLADELQLPVRRWGGNSTTRYNWEINIHNTGSDWYFENVPDSADESPDAFVTQDRRTGSKTLLTVPLIGWTPNRRVEGHPFDCGFKVSKYGAQVPDPDRPWMAAVDPWDADCGSGLRAGNPTPVPITGNDPHDTSMAITTTFVTRWINHLVAEFGTAANGGVQFYDLDNEPMLWSSTHRDVHPEETTAIELRDKAYAYAVALKTADPSAQTLGPVTWGWCAYFCSGAGNCCSPNPNSTDPDRGRFTEWYLEQMQAYETAHGVRLLDYLDLHYYPQADDVALSEAGNANVQALRLRSTRSLWDPTYHDESWIEDTTDEPVQLIPRMKQWVAESYPGTKTAITEYNWGALEHINGALAQADVLGIFGREGLDLATLWGPPTANQPGAYAFRMYLNYDGHGARFGDVSIQAASTDQGRLAIYAAQRSSDGALTLMVINKTDQPLISTLTITNFHPALAVQTYRYSAANLGAIVRDPDQTLLLGNFVRTYPANSMTLFVVTPGVPIEWTDFLYLPLVLRAQ